MDLDILWQTIVEPWQSASGRLLNEEAINNDALLRSDSMTPDFLRKLGVKPGHKVALVNAPEDFQLSFLEAANGLCQVSVDGRPKDLIITWPQRAEDVTNLFPRLCPALKAEGAIWVVIPKKGATKGKPGFPTFPQVQVAGLAAGLVDNKDLGFSPTHYGIRFVVPVASRSSWNLAKS